MKRFLLASGGVLGLLVAVHFALAVPDTTAPTIPTNLNAVVASPSRIDLSWIASTDDVGVAGYQVFRNGVQVATATVPAHINNGLSASTTYTYKVAAFDAAGNVSGQSSAISATTLATPLSDTAAPTIPTGLVASAISASRIDLSWNVSADMASGSEPVSGLAGYKVYRNGVQIATTSSTSYSNTGLDAFTTYNYTVAAYDLAGNTSVQSSVVSATTLALPSSDVSAPSVPANLSAVALSDSRIDLAWSASSDNVGVAGYKIYRNGSFLTTTGATSFSDTGLSASTAYYYIVAAYDAAGNVSVQSNQVSATTLATTVQVVADQRHDQEDENINEDQNENEDLEANDDLEEHHDVHLDQHHEDQHHDNEQGNNDEQGGD